MADTFHARAVRQTHWATVVSFLTILVLPALGYLLLPLPELDENRDRTNFPTLVLKKYSLQDFPKWFEMYCDDHLGFRDVMLRWHRKATYALFRESSSPKAWIGREGWLYFNVDDPDHFRPEKPSLAKRLESWADTFADRHAYLQSRGIPYLVVVAPEKSAIYPEYLPLRRQLHPPPEPSHEISRLLTARGVPHVILLDPLREARQQTDELLYFRTDSHWNPTAGKFAYRAVRAKLQELLPNWTPTPEDTFDAFGSSGGGDLWKFVSPVNDFVPEPCQDYVGRYRTTSENEAEFAPLLERQDNLGYIPLRTYITPQAPGPSMVLIRDSFSTAMFPFYFADFQRVSAIATHRFPIPAIDVEKPKIVVQQIVTRFLYQETAWNPPEVYQFRKARGQ